MAPPRCTRPADWKRAWARLGAGPARGDARVPLLSRQALGFFDQTWEVRTQGPMVLQGNDQFRRPLVVTAFANNLIDFQGLGPTSAVRATGFFAWKFSLAFDESDRLRALTDIVDRVRDIGRLELPGRQTNELADSCISASRSELYHDSLEIYL